MVMADDENSDFAANDAASSSGLSVKRTSLPHPVLVS